MAHYAPNGTVLGDLAKEEERPENPEDNAKEKEDNTGCDHGSGCGGRHGSSGTHRCSGTGTYDPDAPGPVNILDQLVAALCNAALDADPRCHHKQNLDARYLGRRNPHEIEDSDSDEEDNKPRVKIPPPIFKGLPGE